MSIFLQNRDKSFFDHITEEIIEDVVEQSAIIYRVNPESSGYDDLRGESSNKTFFPGIEIKALINYLGTEIETNMVGIDAKRTIEVYIHRKFLSDRNIFFEEGDFIYWDNQYFEISKITEPQNIQGLPENPHEVRVEALSADVSQITVVERTK